MAYLIESLPQDVLKLLKDNLPIPPPQINEAIEVANSQQVGHSAVYRNIYCPDKLVSSLHPSLDTLYKLFEFGCTFNGEKPALGLREQIKHPDGSTTFGKYKWQTYNTIKQRRNNLGSGIFFILENNPYLTQSESHQRIKYDPTRKPEDETFVIAIFSHNRPEWALCDLASVAYSITNTALYDTLGPGTTNYILGLTEAPVVICSKEKIKTLIGLKRDDPQGLANLIAIVSMDKLSSEDIEDTALVKAANENKISLFDIDQVERLGAINPLDPIPPVPKTKFTISFTSGTTGANPKGVILTNENAICAVSFRCMRSFSPDDRYVVYSFLPMAHIYERANIQSNLATGAAIGFPQGRLPATLFDDIRELQPTVLALVPRVLTRLEAAIKAQTINLNNSWVKYIFTKAIDEKMRLQAEPNKEDINPTHIIYDRVLDKLRHKLGMGSVTNITTGSSPISPDTIKFIKAALNLGVSNGYGSTESFAGFLGSFRFDNDPGSIGPIGPTTECRLKDLPEMGYTSKDAGGPRGELLLRGPQIFQGYYKNPEATSEAFDEEGWFLTGDVAKIDPTHGNRMFIIDRVKNFFKMAQGEFITPERIENTYLSAFPFIQQIFVHGNSLESYLVGVVGLDPTTIGNYIKSRFGDEIVDQNDIVAFFNEPKNKKIFLQDLNNSTKNSLQGFEKVHNVDISFDPLTVQRGVVTPTLKIRRPICAKFFKDTLERLYSEGSILRDGKL